ncbi:MAG: hypothetical protein KAJ58_00760 [Candidatus Pacebacteria bacterium]|nr:hypothetical protein [Candidatus Paceibacterota bacterium]
MIKNDTNMNLVKKEEDSTQALQLFEELVLKSIESYGLPVRNVLVATEERAVIFKNMLPVLQKVEPSKIKDSVYISKFLAASAVGLFDAALNYLWDETISEIRKRAVIYDIQYFYDNATNSERKRKKLKKEEDIIKLDDHELIQGARKIGLISEIGYKHLDFIRFNRNWASAAHPNQNKLTGLKLISWLETCVEEVISLPLSNVAIEIQKLLINIKSNEITEEDSKKIISFFDELPQKQANNLALGFLGIYTDEDISPTTRQNIKYLAPSLWEMIEEETKVNIGIRYGKFMANNDESGASLIRGFLDMVEGSSYIPENIKIVEIEDAMENLLDIHHAINNFHNEPIFAKELYNIIGKDNKIPSSIMKKTVFGIIEVFLTNGYGVAFCAEKYYIELIKQFSQKEAFFALISFTEEGIASTLQFSLCENKYRELLNLIKDKLTSSVILELFEKVRKFQGDISLIGKDTDIKQKIANAKVILKK